MLNFYKLITYNKKIINLPALQAEGRRFDSDYLHKEKTALHIVVELFFAFLCFRFKSALFSKCTEITLIKESFYIVFLVS